MPMQAGTSGPPLRIPTRSACGRAHVTSPSAARTSSTRRASPSRSTSRPMTPNSPSGHGHRQMRRHRHRHRRRADRLLLLAPPRSSRTISPPGRRSSSASRTTSRLRGNGTTAPSCPIGNAPTAALSTKSTGTTHVGPTTSGRTSLRQRSSGDCRDRRLRRRPPPPPRRPCSSRPRRRSCCRSPTRRTGQR